MKAKEYVICLLSITLLIAAGSASAGDAYKVPMAVRTAVQARKAELAGMKLGVGQFLHLYQTTWDWDGEKVNVFAGSGYDYAEEILQGILRANLFKSSQIGLSNDPADEKWEYVLTCEQLSSPALGGVKYSLLKQAAPVFGEEIPLPKKWDKVAVSPGGGPGVTDRVYIMKDFGEYLAYKVAAIILGVKAK